jgi:hypothetical protein
MPQNRSISKESTDAEITTMPTEREYFEELRERVFAKAIADGLQIVVPTSNQLQLDIDRPWPAHRALPESDDGNIVSAIIHDHKMKPRQVLNRLLEEFEVIKWQAWKSSGGNCHVILTLGRELDIDKRITMQAILGSDPMREFLNLRRVLCGAEDPIVLFKPPTDRKES